MKELISIIIAAILSGTAGVSHFSCDVQGCTIEGKHEHSYCDVQGCTIEGKHEHSYCDVQGCTIEGEHEHS
ncbi:MAG: hypothetical protein K2K63_13985, partial [Acetatifactor sp.]|nr:hypothetical protein [Acetatifactor sp.]